MRHFFLPTILLLLFCLPGFGQYVSYDFGPATAVGAIQPQGISAAAGRTYPNYHTIQVKVTGAPAACTYDLEGSNEPSISVRASDPNAWESLSGSQSCTTNNMGHLQSKVVKFVRVNLTALSGGTTPEVSFFWLASQ